MRKLCFLAVLLPLLLFRGCKEASTAPAEMRETGVTPPAYLVVLDCGHGGFDAGARGDDTGVREDELNLAVGMLLKEALEELGVQVSVTRSESEALGDTKKEDMRRRGELLCAEGADAVVSVHMNHFSDRKVAGPMTFYQAGAEEGQELAQVVMDALCAGLGLKARLANPGNNFVTRIPAAPAVLVECGFLSNPEEELRLQEPEYQQKLARAIAAGVRAYLQAKSEEALPSFSPAAP